jgi:carboxyl-terminal processing protease
MIDRFARRILLLLLLSGGLSAGLYSAEPVLPEAPSAALSITNVFHPVEPGLFDGRIAYVTAVMLTNNQYLRKPFTAAVSSKFLDRYLEVFDPQHIHFTQGDLAELEIYRTNLDRLTITPRHAGDTRPGCVIFNRFMERLQQRTAYAEELLRTNKFTFDTDERVVLNRHELPYPKDLNEAKQLWGERLRAEYLSEKLGKIDAKTNTNSAPPAANTQPPQSKPKTEDEEIVETLSHRYNRNLRAFEEWDHDDVLEIYLTTLAHVYDPHSDYMGKPQMDSFQIQMNLSLCGIGAELQQTPDGYCKINRLLPNGPAMKSKQIKEGDRIIGVAQGNQPPVDIVDMSLNKAVQLIRGEKGTEVRLTLLPAGASLGTRNVVSMIRDDIPLEDSAAKAKIIDLPDSHGGNLRLGVIDLPSFYANIDLGGSRSLPEPKNDDPGASTKSTTLDVMRLLTKLKQENVQGVILDLRRNGGGSLEEAIRLTGLFIKDGPVVQVKDFLGNIKVEEDPDPSVQYEGPLIVLTSRFSASASEILAGALQDYGRALIVGDISTHGKGTVQMVEKLDNHMGLAESVLKTNDPGALKLTIKKFYRPSGASTQKKGVTSDIVLPSIWNESKEVGEAALDNPLPYDTIQSARFDQLNLVSPYLAELRKRSDERLTVDKEFAYVREDVELFKKQQADKTVSLNQKDRLKEKEESDARAKARDAERLTRKAPDEKVYELTLRLASQPGLPPPLTNSPLSRITPLSADTNALSSGTFLPTNSTLASVSSGNAGATAMAAANAHALQDPAAEAKPPATDATLTEAEHILVDYISLLPKGKLVSANTPKPGK